MFWFCIKPNAEKKRPVINFNIFGTVEPRFNEVAGDRPNLSVKWRVRYIEKLDITNLRGNDQNVCYIEVIVNDWFVTQVTSVEILQCQYLRHVISHWLKGCCLFTIRIKGCVDCWCVQRLSSAACWHCNSLYRGRFYVWASGLCSLYRRIRHIQVLFQTFYCNFGREVKSRSLYRGDLNRGSLNRGSTVFNIMVFFVWHFNLLHILKLKPGL